MHDPPAQMVIGPSINVAELRLAAGRVQAWHKTDPRSQIAPGPEVSAVVRGHDRACQAPPPRHRRRRA
jgi:hypothetical protein